MVGLLNSNYPITTLFTINKVAQFRPRMPVIRCSVHVLGSSLPSRRIRRKNYLRPKILKTLTKPRDLGNAVVVPLEQEKPGFEVVEELEMSVGGVRETRGANVMGFKGINGTAMFKIIVSFLGLFIVQTVVSVVIMGLGESSEKERGPGSEGVNGSVIVDEVKFAEIRRMAREVRESERRRREMEKEGDDAEDESDDDEDAEIDDSVKNDIAKEVDGRLTMLRKRSPMPVHNVNFLKKAGGLGTGGKNEGVDGKEDVDRLMVEAKRKFRSHMKEQGGKPKGFEGIDDDREKGGNVNHANSERSNIGTRKDEKSVFQSSVPLQEKRTASEKVNPSKGINGASSLRSDSSISSLSKGINKGAKPDSGLLQDRNNLDGGAKLKESSVIEIQESQRMINGLNASTSNMHELPRRNGKSDSGTPRSKLSTSTSKDEKNIDDPDLWWSTLPCVYAILMQKGLGSKAQQGFYTLHINSGAEYESSYTVAFEDQTDARNFSYILDCAFGDLPDAAVDVILISTKELKEIVESGNKNVLVARKGEIKLFASQPLEEAESALRLLVK